jgi:hypothetical protein
MIFTSLDGLKLTLTAKLNVTDTIISLNVADTNKLCSGLGANYTYLTIANAGQIETMKATCVGGVINVVRAQNGTSAITAPGGTCIAFQWVKSAITDFIAQGGGVAGICDLTNGSPERLEIVPDPINSCAKKLTIKSCQSTATWRFGNIIYKQELDGCIKTEAATDCILVDGTYQNATLVFKDGKICSVKEGTNIVHSGGGCCTCSNCSGSGSSTPATLACPVVATTIQPGQYGPFTINGCGFITAYNSSLNNFNATVPVATNATSGTVTLVNPAAPAGNSVVTYSYLQTVIGGMSLSLCNLPNQVADNTIRLAGCKGTNTGSFSFSELKTLFATPLNLCSTPAYVNDLITPTQADPLISKPTAELLAATIVVCIGGTTQSLSMQEFFDAIKAHVAP